MKDWSQGYEVGPLLFRPPRLLYAVGRYAYETSLPQQFPRVTGGDTSLSEVDAVTIESESNIDTVVYQKTRPVPPRNLPQLPPHLHQLSR